MGQYWLCAKICSTFLDIYTGSFWTCWVEKQNSELNYLLHATDLSVLLVFTANMRFKQFPLPILRSFHRSAPSFWIFKFLWWLINLPIWTAGWGSWSKTSGRYWTNWGLYIFSNVSSSIFRVMTRKWSLELVPSKAGVFLLLQRKVTQT